MATINSEYKVVERFKGSKTYISMGGMSMREIDLDTASQEELKLVYDQGNTQVIEKIDKKVRE